MPQKTNLSSLSYKIDYITQASNILNHWFKSYGYCIEWVNFACWWVLSVTGLRAACVAGLILKYKGSFQLFQAET